MGKITFFLFLCLVTTARADGIYKDSSGAWHFVNPPDRNGWGCADDIIAPCKAGQQLNTITVDGCRKDFCGEPVDAARGTGNPPLANSSATSSETSTGVGSCASAKCSAMAAVCVKGQIMVDVSMPSDCCPKYECNDRSHYCGQGTSSAASGTAPSRSAL